MSDLKNTVSALYGGVAPQEAMPFGAANTPEGTQTGLGSVLSAIMGIPKHLIDAAQQAPVGVPTEQQTPEQLAANKRLIDASGETALSLAGVGTPMSASGSAGIFGGKLAKTADLDKLVYAERRYAEGVPQHVIRKETDWFKLPTDNKWRFEIPDQKSSITYMPPKEGDRAMGPLSALMRHPDAFKAYPEAAALPVDITKQTSVPRGAGTFDSNTNTIGLIVPDSERARSIGLHELQHYIQKREGFAPGINKEYYASEIEKGLRKKPELLGVYDFDKIKNEAANLYHKTAGEVEARNVQKRADYSTLARRSHDPWNSQDTLFQDQIVFDPVTRAVRALRGN